MPEVKLLADVLEHYERVLRLYSEQERLGLFRNRALWEAKKLTIHTLVEQIHELNPDHETPEPSVDFKPEVLLAEPECEDKPKSETLICEAYVKGLHAIPAIYVLNSPCWQGITPYLAECMQALQNNVVMAYRGILQVRKEHGNLNPGRGDFMLLALYNNLASLYMGLRHLCKQASPIAATSIPEPIISQITTIRSLLTKYLIINNLDFALDVTNIKGCQEYQSGVFRDCKLNYQEIKAQLEELLHTLNRIEGCKYMDRVLQRLHAVGEALQTKLIIPEIRLPLSRLLGFAEQYISNATVSIPVPRTRVMPYPYVDHAPVDLETKAAESHGYSSGAELTI